MINKVVVRREDDDVEIPETFASFPGFETKRMTFSEQESYLRHYQERMQSLLQGFELLINAQSDKTIVPEIKEAALTYARAIYKGYAQRLVAANTPADDLDKSQQVLDQYISRLTNVVATEFAMDEGNAVRLLDKAEQYAVLEQGRPALVSISSLDDFTIVQVEEPIPALSDSLLNDYYAVVDPETKFADKPEWYRAMAPRERTLLDYCLRDIKAGLSAEEIDESQAKQQLADLITTLSSKLRTIPALPNLARTHLYIYDRDGNLVRHQQRMRSSMISSRDVLKQRPAIRDVHTEENLKHIIELQVANQVRDMAVKLGMSVDGLMADEQFSLPILVQTLITPQVPSRFTPDNAIHADKTRAISKISKDVLAGRFVLTVDGHTVPKQKIAFYGTNHPQNLRLGERFYSTFADEAPQAFQDKGDLITNAQHLRGLMLAQLETFDDDSQEYATLRQDYELLGGAIKEYNSVLSRGLGLETQNRELILSSLEQVITELSGGVAYGSCVSGKDRKGIETLHTNAMWTYVAKHNCVPDMSDATQRNKFAALFAKLFVTRHQQENAGQNAPGANGIKTPKKYLPKDILDAIEAQPGGKKILEESDRLATNNEAKKCIKTLDDSSKKQHLQSEYSEAKQRLTSHYAQLDTDYRHFLSIEIPEVRKDGRHVQSHTWVRQQLSAIKKLNDIVGRLEDMAKTLEPETLRNTMVNEQARHLIDASFHAESTREYMELIVASLRESSEQTPQLKTQLEDARTYFTDLCVGLDRISKLQLEATLSGELIVLQEVFSTFAAEPGPEATTKCQEIFSSPFMNDLQTHNKDSYVSKLIYELDVVPTIKSFYNPNMELISLLDNILDETSQWQHSAVRLRIGGRDLLKFGETKGLKAIRGIMADRNLTADKKVRALIKAVEKRGASTVKRQSNVNTLYGLIKLADKQPALAVAELKEFLTDIQDSKGNMAADYIQRFDSLVTDPSIHPEPESDESKDESEGHSGFSRSSDH